MPTRVSTGFSTLKAPVVVALVVFGGIVCSSSAVAQGASSTATTSVRGDFSAACKSGASDVDRATCLKEAAAAQGEARRGQLTSPDSAYQANALQRCEALPESDKQLCKLRIEGAGKTDGSIGGGGVIREITTPVSPSNNPAK